MSHAGHVPPHRCLGAASTRDARAVRVAGLPSLCVGVALCAVAVFADPPLTAAWLPGVLLVVRWWADRERRHIERRRKARAGWLHA